ncbi:MAG: hypothetical protein WAN36_15205 [Calditrichia bacterium]
MLRNLLITQGYYEFSAALAERAPGNANWCTFATWASKQAGRTIRNEDLQRALVQLLQTSPLIASAVAVIKSPVVSLGAEVSEPVIRNALLRILNTQAIGNAAGNAVARGNVKVFSEIGREFGRFFETVLQQEEYSRQKIDHFISGLKSGGPPAGQEYLRRAFRHLYQSLFEKRPKVQAELIFLANLEIGFHEQTRLQPEIESALNAAIPDPDEFRRRLMKILLPLHGWPARIWLFLRRLFGKPSPFEKAVAHLYAETASAVRRLITTRLMEIRLADNPPLKLGEDHSRPFPPLLTDLKNPDLLELLKQVDPTPDSLRESGARDWSDFPDRMHFICDLFRCYQNSAEISAPPFTPFQTELIKAGKIPPGDL